MVNHNAGTLAVDRIDMLVIGGIQFVQNEQAG
jgi:hypothetical protein